jgi:hypothetical protein
MLHQQPPAIGRTAELVQHFLEYGFCSHQGILICHPLVFSFESEFDSWRYQIF